MPQSAFQIEFTHNETPYLGTVMPLGSSPAAGFAILLERDHNVDSQFYLEIFLKPASLDNWQYECGEGEKATHYYDQELLDTIGESIR